MVNSKIVNNMKLYIQPQTAIQATAPINLMLGASNHVVTSEQGIQANGLGKQYTDAI